MYFHVYIFILHLLCSLHVLRFKHLLLDIIFIQSTMWNFCYILYANKHDGHSVRSYFETGQRVPNYCRYLNFILGNAFHNGQLQLGWSAAT